MPKTAQKFLTARWEKLIMANYAIDPEILLPYLPRHTKLDFWQGKTYVSLVGFLFKDTRVLGVSIPYHIHFEEVNLRFYVKYQAEDELRRGVCFIKEIVPKPMIAVVARNLYGEKYISLPMQHQIKEEENTLKVQYSWLLHNQWQSMQVNASNQPQEMLPDSEEEFIAEHYWGYTAINGGKTAEYKVEHPRWRVFSVKDFELNCAVAQQYGKPFQSVFMKQPTSVFLAEGSEVAVRMGQKIA